MRFINKLRFTYSIIFLIIGLVLGYLAGAGSLSGITGYASIETEEIIEEESIEEIMTELIEEDSQIIGFATITSSGNRKNDLVILGFEGLMPLDTDFYEGWIFEFQDGEAITKISIGKFNINKDGIIVDTNGEVIDSEDPNSATFSQRGANGDVDLPIDILDSSREFKIVITLEPGDEDLDDLNPSDKVVLSGKVENTIVVLNAP